MTIRKTTAPSAPRPKRFSDAPVPQIPEVDRTKPDEASVEYSHYRTGLSRRRTGLSEHRTDLSEYRTDLSGSRTELSMRRTGMSIHRTRMSADRTLMSVIRTSLSLIGFGFTLHQAFSKLRDVGTIHNDVAPRNFGISLIVLGVVLLVGGIWRHVQFAWEMRQRRQEMMDNQLIHGESRYPVSTTLIGAIALLGIGVAAFCNIAFDLTLFG